MESFVCSAFQKSQDVDIMRRTFVDKGSLKAALLTKYKAPLHDFMTEEEQKIYIDTFLQGGLAAPLCYYKIMVNNGRNSDDASKNHNAVTLSSSLKRLIQASPKTDVFLRSPVPFSLPVR